jgi:metal-responsive CopG/Arc/MetJ family transcriptional regulator
MKQGHKAVSIPLELAHEIDKLVGRRNRTAFMRETIQRYLADPELLATLKLKRRDDKS